MTAISSTLSVSSVNLCLFNCLFVRPELVLGVGDGVNLCLLDTFLMPELVLGVGDGVGGGGLITAEHLGDGVCLGEGVGLGDCDATGDGNINFFLVFGFVCGVLVPGLLLFCFLGFFSLKKKMN